MKPNITNSTFENQLKRYSLPVPPALYDRRIETVVREAEANTAAMVICSMAVRSIRRNLCILAGTAAVMLISLHVQQFLPGILNTNTNSYYGSTVTGMFQDSVITSITCNTGTTPQGPSGRTRPSCRIHSAQNAYYYTRRNSWFSITN